LARDVVDFRYHALSLVAVFLALAVGLLMGVAVGDSGLASSARDALRDGLRGDVVRVREELERRERFEQRAWPALVAGRLRGVEVGVVSSDGAVVDAVRAAVEAAGGSVVARTSGIEGGVYGGRAAVVVELSSAPAAVRPDGWSSVDNVDEPAGKVALVLLLAGAAEGEYGRKPGADDIVPEDLGR
jgi:copper transport outer membrane protein MctB